MKYIILAAPYLKHLQIRLSKLTPSSSAWRDTKNRIDSPDVYGVEFELIKIRDGVAYLKPSLEVPEDCIAALTPSQPPTLPTACPLPYEVGQIVDVLFVKMEVISRRLTQAGWEYECLPTNPFEMSWARADGKRVYPHSYLTS